MQNKLFEFLVDDSLSYEENARRLMKYRGNSTEQIPSNYEELLSMFCKDSISNYEVTWYNRENHINKWTKSFASNRLCGNYISWQELEPFIARYVIAINQIGIKTFWSCDGWHKKSEHVLGIGFLDRNSMIWHKIISSRIEDGENIEWQHCFPKAILKLPKEDNEKLKMYATLNRRATYLEKNRAKFLDLKRDIIEKVKNKPKNMLTDDELEMFLLKHMLCI